MNDVKITDIPSDVKLEKDVIIKIENNKIKDLNENYINTTLHSDNIHKDCYILLKDCIETDKNTYSHVTEIFLDSFIKTKIRLYKPIDKNDQKIFVIDIVELNESKNIVFKNSAKNNISLLYEQIDCLETKNFAQANGFVIIAENGKADEFSKLNNSSEKLSDIFNSKLVSGETNITDEDLNSLDTSFTIIPKYTLATKYDFGSPTQKNNLYGWVDANIGLHKGRIVYVDILSECKFTNEIKIENIKTITAQGQRGRPPKTVMGEKETVFGKSEKIEETKILSQKTVTEQNEVVLQKKDGVENQHDKNDIVDEDKNKKDEVLQAFDISVFM